VRLLGGKAALDRKSTKKTRSHTHKQQTQTLNKKTHQPDASAAGASGRSKERFVLSVAYSPDAKLLAASGMDGAVALFDAETGALLHALKGHHRPVRSLAFTPDSRMLLTGSDDMHAHLYDCAQGGLVDAFSGHESWVLSVAAHPSGSCFATGSSDARVKLWDLSTRTCAQTIGDHKDQVWCVGFSGDAGGTRLATASDDKHVAVYAVA
jgi:WD repeat-containing protein 61